MNTSTIYVVVPVHNRRALTEKFIVSLDEQTVTSRGTRVHLVLVDDGSTDGSDKLLEGRDDSTLIRGNGSWWWAGSIDQTLRHLSTRLDDKDFVYLGNNDTILDPAHLQRLMDTSEANPDALIGSVSFEIWPTGEHHPVSSGFLVDPKELQVRNLPGEASEIQPADALAGRGLLLPARAARRARLHPNRLPQHFADLAFTYALGTQGYRMLVDPRATSTQLERAGSSVQFAPRITDMVSKRSQLYLPAIVNFWWLLSSPAQRATLIPRLIQRGFTQLRAGAYKLN